jgi:transposase
VIFVGDDWAEGHHDVEIVDEQGQRLARRRLPEGVEGVAELHALVGDHLGDRPERDVPDDPAQVVVGIETDRGPWVQALLAAGYQVYAVNPVQVARYRERHGTSGAKSDPGDAHVLAELVRLDRVHHRPLAPNSAVAEQVKVLARTHQNLVWTRQRQANALRSMLREYYPAALAAFGTDLAGRDALAVLTLAPGPEQGRALSLSRIEAALRRAGRQRNVRVTAQAIQAALRSPQLPANPAVVPAYTASAAAMVAVLGALAEQEQAFRAQVEADFGQHPDAEIYLSQPGLGPVLAARVLAEFGDAAGRYADARARKNYSGMAPITKASGIRRVVLARHARNRRLADALYQQAFAALRTSPGARRYYDNHRSVGATHHQALRALANRLVGILHGCLEHHVVYDEKIAWQQTSTADSAAA